MLVFVLAALAANVNDVLTTIITTPLVLNYTITPTATTGGCVGTPLTLTVTVNPAPQMTSAATASICSGNSLNVGLTANPASTFSWVTTNNANI